jgi:uncharacterized phage protein (TIGR02218 family)
VRTPTDAAGRPGATVALLNGGADFVMADLYTLTLNGGAVIRWSGAGVPIAFNGLTWPIGPLLNRGKITTKLGVEVSTLEITLIAGSADLINGVPAIAYIRGAGLDGATLKLERAFLPSWSSPVTGTVIDFSGRVTSIKDLSRSQCTITVSSWLVLVNVNMGPDLFQAGCLNTLYDGACTLNAASYAVTGAVTAAVAPTVTSIASSLSALDGEYTQGKIIFTSGVNAGLARAVKTYVQASGQLWFAYPLPAPCAAGDAFTAYPGCDLTMSRCSGRFNNLIHFRGQPFTPPAITGVLG